MKKDSKSERLNLQLDLLALLCCYIVLSCLSIFPNATKAQDRQSDKGVGVKLVGQLPSKEKRWALIIGVDEYEKDISSLKGAVNDAKALKKVLVEYAGFPEDQVILLTTDADNSDQLPRRVNILDELNKLSYRVPEDGLLLFSFSGHGISVGKDAYLIPSDGRITKNLKLLRDFSIDVQRIKETIEEIKVKQVLMLLDACRNEPGKGETPNPLTEAYKRGFRFDVVNSEVKAFATLYATSIGERAFEFFDSETKQYRGYFSYAIEEGMGGEAVNVNGAITLGSLITYVENTVPKKVRFEKGENQEPFKEIAGYKEGELVLSIAKAKEVLKPDAYTGINGDRLFWKEIEKRNTIAAYESYLWKYPIGEFAQVAKIRLANFKWESFKGIARNLLKYASIESFSEGLAVTATYTNDLLKYGVINENGREVVPPKYDFIDKFIDGLALVTLNHKRGFIDKSGKEVIPPIYTIYDGDSFSEGLISASINDKAGFIDKSGNVAIPFDYDFADSFSEGLAMVRLNKKYGFINRTGKLVIPLEYEIPLKYEVELSFSEGLATACLNRKCGFIDKTGKLRIPLKYEDAFPFSEGLAMVKLNGKYGFIDKNGREIIPFKYEDFDSYYSISLEGKGRTKGFEEDIAAVKLKGKYGFIDRAGKAITPFKYEYVGSFSEGFASVSLNDKHGLIDKKGKEIIPVKYDFAYISGGLIYVGLNNQWGLLDKTSKEFFPLKYEEFRQLSEDLTMVKLNGKYGLLDKTGKYLIPPKYDWVFCMAFFGDGFIGATLNGKKGFIDIYGNEYFDFQ